MEPIKRLWNRNFAILWQSQFISDFGSALFSVALGFWVLNMTKTAAMPGGDKALMGLVLACFAIPKVVLGPFAGAVADRLNRKWIIILADAVRGTLYTLMGIALFGGIFPFGAIYPLAVLAGACDAFFAPALSSSIPDIVPAGDLTKANSARSVSTTATQLVGNALGGVLFSLLKAPLMILVNGISFLYAAATQVFMRIPDAGASARKKHLLRDMKDGIAYAFGHPGLRLFMVMCMVISFFMIIGITLLTPLFDSTPGFGARNYGYLMGSLMAGAVSGMLLFTFLKIKPSRRSLWFGVAIMATAIGAVPIGFITNVNLLFPLAFVTGVFHALENMMMQTILQATVPSGERGKVFGIFGTVTGALSPIGMALSGVIAQSLGVRPTIVISFSIVVMLLPVLLASRKFRAYVNHDNAVPAGVE